MNASQIDQYLSASQSALRTFLSTLLGKEALLKLDAPTDVAFAATEAEATAMLSVIGRPATGDGFCILIEPSWLPLLSKSMLGEAMTIEDPGYEDLTSELAGQGYGTIRTQLASLGEPLQEVTFDISPPHAAVPAGSLGELLSRISFSMTYEEETYRGVALIPSLVSEALASAPPEPAPPAPTPAPPTLTRAPQAPAAPMAPPVSVSPVSFPDLGQESLSGDGMHSFGLLAEVELEVTVELGRRHLPLSDILRLTTGSVVELEKLVGEPLQLFANGRFIAEGEAIVIDEQFGIRITSLAVSNNREKAFR